MENIIAVIGSIVAIIVSLSTALKNFADAKKNLIPKKVKKQSDININIYDLLEEMKEVFKADRIQIYDFHNGSHYANGRSSLKCSCTFECVRKTVTSYFDRLQGIHLQMIPHFIHELLNEEKIIVRDIETLKDTMPATYNFKKNQNVNSFYDIVLKNSKGESIGFIGIQYLEKNAIYVDESELKKYKYLIEENLEKLKDKE